MSKPKTQHSLFGPSSLRRRSLCPGSYAAEKVAPEQPTSADAQRGTDLHAAVSEWVMAGEEGWTVPKGMGAPEAEAIEFCARAVIETLAQHAGKPDLYPDCKLTFKTIPDIGLGTADLVAVWDHEGEPVAAHVFEFKFGYVPEPPANENIQLAAYAYGVSLRHPTVRSVSVSLIQPAIHAVSVHDYGQDGLAITGKTLVEIVAKAKASDAPRCPGEAQCKYCRGAATCPALRQTMDIVPADPTVTALAPATIGKLLSQALIAEQFIDALRGHAMELAQAGTTIPGWALGEGRSTRAWTMDARPLLEQAAKALGKPPQDLDITTMASPAQLEQAWGKSKQVREALAPLIVKQPGRPALKQEDKR